MCPGVFPAAPCPPTNDACCSSPQVQEFGGRTGDCTTLHCPRKKLHESRVVGRVLRFWATCPLAQALWLLSGPPARCGARLCAGASSMRENSASRERSRCELRTKRRPVGAWEGGRRKKGDRHGVGRTFAFLMWNQAEVSRPGHYYVHVDDILSNPLLL